MAIAETTSNGTNGPSGGNPGAGESPIPECPSKAPARATWGGKVEFLLSAIGFAVGLGNVWRFPHLCYKNGGGAFLIPYSLMILFLGLPLFYLELAWGQYASLGPLTIWRCAPLFKGLGYTMVSVSLIVSIYYNVILGYTIFYLFASFTSELPWSHCNHTWNTPSCVERQYHGEYVVNFTTNATNGTLAHLNTSDVSLHSAHDHVTSPAEEYWDYYVLGVTEGIDVGHLGHIRWHLALCLLLAWIIVFLCILQGIKSSGKVVYFTATFPYVVLLILFVRGVTLPGASNGLIFYLFPDFKKMGHAKVWSDAAVQILYSLGPGFGSLLTMGSYNKFHNNCCKDAITVVLVNCGTSVFAGFVIFSILGFMAEVSGLPVSEVAKSGPGLAFIAYPEALAMMPAAPFWSIMFFFMLLTLGLDSQLAKMVGTELWTLCFQFAGMECIMTGLVDENPGLLRWKTWITAGVCFFLFILGLPCVTQGGIFVFQLLDKYATTVPLLIATAMETCIISWVYGWRRFSCDLEAMMGRKPNYYWLACWMGICPGILMFILVFYFVEYDGMEYAGYVYPQWAEGLGWLIVASVLSLIPLAMLRQCHAKAGSWKELFTSFLCLSRHVPGSDPCGTTCALQYGSLLLPEAAWGPADAQHRHKQFADLERLREDEAQRRGMRVRYSARGDRARIVEEEEEEGEGAGGEKGGEGVGVRVEGGAGCKVNKDAGKVRKDDGAVNTTIHAHPSSNQLLDKPTNPTASSNLDTSSSENTGFMTSLAYASPGDSYI